MKHIVNIISFVAMFYVGFLIFQFLMNLIFVPMTDIRLGHPLISILVMVAFLGFNSAFAYITSAKITDIINYYYKFDS